jgi:hypothetical protein
MAHQKLLTQTLLEFASTFVRDFTISDVLHDLAERAAAVAGLAETIGGWGVHGNGALEAGS